MNRSTLLVSRAGAKWRFQTELFATRASTNFIAIAKSLFPPGGSVSSFFGETAPSFDFAGGMAD